MGDLGWVLTRQLTVTSSLSNGRQKLRWWVETKRSKGDWAVTRSVSWKLLLYMARL